MAWKLGFSMGGDYLITDDVTGTTVCRVISDNISHVQAHKRACLLQAAPDLLKELKLAIKMLPEESELTITNKKKARRAVLKAEGVIA